MSHIDDASMLPVTWWKSSRSDTGAQCVECGIVDAGERILAVRDSKQPAGPALLLSYAAFGGLVEGVKHGAL
ncbi:DUF397 domain-containing protein [Streptomyces sp. APSN-46.1]|uniref:DUF397 domain-containing protein n=1 Tax=Streptomyces sp. APSN-46.1 TaxID=2929049 RepID=UPI001FB33606|nr:DUF397 domain-containing protein [Streptomyces sp. APSN-46.1]MCJ1678936.1 DUF397 domain-containing protein [Streptomyces sp. APSN-46.1]